MVPGRLRGRPSNRRKEARTHVAAGEDLGLQARHLLQTDAQVAFVVAARCAGQGTWTKCFRCGVAGCRQSQSLGALKCCTNATSAEEQTARGHDAPANCKVGRHVALGRHHLGLNVKDLDRPDDWVGRGHFVNARRLSPPRDDTEFPPNGYPWPLHFIYTRCDLNLGKCTNVHV